MKLQANKNHLFHNLMHSSSSNNNKNLLNLQHHLSNSNNIMIHMNKAIVTQMEQALPIKLWINRSQRTKRLRASSIHPTTIMKIQVMVQSRMWHLRKHLKFCLNLIKFHINQLLNNNSSSTSLFSNNYLSCSKIIRSKQHPKKDWLSLTTRMMMRVSSQPKSHCL
jgi:hypothetical protein